MSITDDELIEFLNHDEQAVRSAALELLSHSYAHDRRILEAVYRVWDRLGVESAFPEFTLLPFLPIDRHDIAESVARARSMAQNRKLVDKTCRCAGKLLESVVAVEPRWLAEHLSSIEEAQQSSKIFFRVSLEFLRLRIDCCRQSEGDLLDQLDDNDPAIAAASWEGLHSIDPKNRLLRLPTIASDDSIHAASRQKYRLELARNHPKVGSEKELLASLSSDDASIADSATVALVRCRTAEVQTQIAQTFGTMNRTTQLRSLEIVRRMRLSNASELIRYLLPMGRDASVQDAARVAELLVLDFNYLEDWLEAFLLVDEPFLARVQPTLALATALVNQKLPLESSRFQQLIASRSLV